MILVENAQYSTRLLAATTLRNILGTNICIYLKHFFLKIFRIIQKAQKPYKKFYRIGNRSLTSEIL